MKKINYKSDFDFLLRLTDCKGDAIPFPDCDWDARFYTSSKANAYVASCRDGICVNCIKEEDGVRFVFDRHNLGVGTLKWEPHFEFPNGIYPDGIQDKYEPQPLDIELVPGRGDCATQAEIEAILPVIKGEDGAPGAPGEKMTYADLTEEDKEDLMAPFKKTLTEKADRTELSNIVGEPTDEEFEDIEPGIIRDALRKTEQELTPEEQAQVKTNLGISKMELFCDLFNASAGNAGYARITNGEFDCKLNELTLTYEEAIDVYQAGVVHGVTANLYRNNPKIRTTFPIVWTRSANAADCQEMFQGCRKVEVIVFDGNNNGFNNFWYTFYNCPNLTTIKNLRIMQVTTNINNSFKFCAALTNLDMLLYNISKDISVDLSECPLITLDSYAGIVSKSSLLTGVVTLIVHPSVYSKLNDETNTEWHAVLTAAAAKNINFATTA